MVQIFREARRVLRNDGTLWLNLGDSYAGSWGNYHPNSPPGKHGQRLKKSARWNRPAYSDQKFLPPTAKCPGLKPKDLAGIPFLVVLALRSDGWYYRQTIIWSKKNPVPSSATDRPTTSHEYIFLMSKRAKYYYDADAIKEKKAENSMTRYNTQRFGDNNKAKGPDAQYGVFGGDYTDAEKENPYRNKRSVWEVNTVASPDTNFATFPPKLITPCILAGSKPGSLVLDPFMGTGTVAVVAEQKGRRYLGIELCGETIGKAAHRLSKVQKEMFT